LLVKLVEAPNLQGVVIIAGGDMDLTPKVISIVAREQHLDPGLVKRESTFEELGVDSLAGVNILFALEEEFQIDVPDAVVREAKSIGQVADALSQALAGKGFPSPNASPKGEVAPTSS
jgi:acyl carrier protein